MSAKSDGSAFAGSPRASDIKIVDDSLRSASVAFDFCDVNGTCRGTQLREIGAGRDHLERVAQLVGDLGGNFADRDEARVLAR